MKNKRQVFCVKEKSTNKLLPMAGLWSRNDDPEIEKFLKSNPDCEVVECEIVEI